MSDDRVHKLFVLIAFLASFACTSPIGMHGAATFAAAPIRGQDPIISPDTTLSVADYMQKARKARSQEQWDLAEAYYQNVLIRDSSNLHAILELAEVYERTGKLTHARGLLIRASFLEPYNKEIIHRNLEIERELSRTLHQEVDSLVARKDYEPAIPKLSLLLTLEPENPELYYTKALCHYNLGRSDAALPAIEKALRLRNNESFNVLYEKILERMNQDKVHSLIRQAADFINPQTNEDKEKALLLLAQIIELDPDNGWAKQEFLRISEGEPGSHVNEIAGAPGPGISFGRRLSRLGSKIYSLALHLLLAVARRLELLIVLLIVLLMFNSPISQTLLKGFQPRSLLSGKLSRFSIIEILTFINSQACTGTLSIRGSIKGEIFFEKGEAYHCQAGNLKGKEALQAILRGAKEGYFVFKESNPQIERTIDMPLSLIMMDLPERKASVNEPAPSRKTKSKIAQLLESGSKDK